MWVIDSVTSFVPPFPQLPKHLHLVFQMQREGKEVYDENIHYPLLLTLTHGSSPALIWSELGNAISCQAAFLYRPPRLCHCVLTSCACAHTPYHTPQTGFLTTTCVCALKTDCVDELPCVRVLDLFTVQ